QIMRVFSAITIFAIVAALASSTSAKRAAAPDTAGADDCPAFCILHDECAECTVRQLGIFCMVSRVSTFTSVQY
ncbi:hypothetical protein P692DRAFT_20827490, partial [Suillus brevipes Sb2]